jgi:hypothetical protein
MSHRGFGSAESAASQSSCICGENEEQSHSQDVREPVSRERHKLVRAQPCRRPAEPSCRATPRWRRPAQPPPLCAALLLLRVVAPSGCHQPRPPVGNYVSGLDTSVAAVRVRVAGQTMERRRDRAARRIYMPARPRQHRLNDLSVAVVPRPNVTSVAVEPPVEVKEAKSAAHWVASPTKGAKAAASNDRTHAKANQIPTSPVRLRMSSR